ncbi:MAG: hypothetical protein ACOWWH_02890 [Eubacteriaceae bacterium]
MDFFGGIIFIFLLLIIIECIRDIRNLIISAEKQKIDIVIVLISTVILLSITYLYANTWFHNIIGILGASIPIIGWASKGITTKGFRSIARLGYWTNWNNLKKVQVTIENKIKVTFYNRYLQYDIHYYKKDDYNRIITLLRENLADEIISIDEKNLS